MMSSKDCGLLLYYNLKNSIKIFYIAQKTCFEMKVGNIYHLQTQPNLNLYRSL